MSGVPARVGPQARALALAALLAANLLIAVLALQDNRGYQFLLFVYWAETLVIAGWNLVKMMVVALARPAPVVTDEVRPALLRTVLALVAIGAYAFALLVLALALFVAIGMLDLAFHGADSDAHWRLPKAATLRSADYAWAVGALVVSHGFSFCANFLVRREYRATSLWWLALQPFARTAVLLVLLLAGAAIAAWRPAIAATTLFTVLLVGVKIVADVAAHVAEHRRRADGRNGGTKKIGA